MIERINLVPQKPYAEKVKSALPLILGILVAAVLVTTFLEYRVLAYKLHKVDKQMSTFQKDKLLADQLQIQVNSLKTTLSRLGKEESELHKNVAALDITSTNKKYFSRALSTIASTLPDSVKCKKITFENKTGQITGVAVQYGDLPDLVTRLKNNPLFKTAALKNVDKSTGSNKDQLLFTINLELQ